MSAAHSTRRQILLLTALPWIYHPKWKYWGLALMEMSICSLAPSCKGIIWVRMGWCHGLPEPRVPPILLSTPMAWFKLCSARVQLSTPLQGGCKNTQIFCGNTWCKGLGLQAQESAPHVQLTKKTRTKLDHLRESGESISTLFLWDVWGTKWNKYSHASQCIKLHSDFLKRKTRDCFYTLNWQWL